MFNYTETHELLMSLIGNAPFGILTTDYEGYVSIVNGQFLQDLNINQEPNDLIDTLLVEHISKIPELSNSLMQCLEEGEKHFDFLSMSFHDKYLNLRGRKLVNGIIVTTENVTTQKEIEHFQAMLDGQEKERQRLAKEIHDGIGPLLSTLTLNIEGLRLEIKENAPQLLEPFNNVLQFSKSINRDLRNISHALMPGTLIDFGLALAIENLCTSIEKSADLNIEFFKKGMENRLPQNIELALYRIAQEVLNNTMKYAEAKNLTIQLIKYEESVLLMIEDDGVGFDKSKIKNAKNKGIGLKNIGIRAKSIGGTLNIDTQPKRGVSVTVDVPL